MRDADGVEWLSVKDAARVVRVRESAIYVWISRRKVDAHKVRGRAYVRMPDVMAAEAEWVRRAERARLRAVTEP